MKYFDITIDTCTIGFQEHVFVRLGRPIDEQLRRRQLHHRQGEDKGKPLELKKIIERNASLRVEFGWSFESSTHFESIMSDCVDIVFPKFNVTDKKPFGYLTTDLRCSWLGFVPFNIFEQEIFDDMTIPELIDFNNELINFQVDVVKFLTQHKVFRQHAILRDAMIKFNYFKEVRQDPDALADAYQYYMEAIRDACLLETVPRDLIEMEIGCHFLHNPDLFFQLLNFSILQGTVYG